MFVWEVLPPYLQSGMEFGMEWMNLFSYVCCELIEKTIPGAAWQSKATVNSVIFTQVVCFGCP
jgi:hypothetical protein